MMCMKILVLILNTVLFLFSTILLIFSFDFVYLFNKRVQWFLEQST